MIFLFFTVFCCFFTENYDNHFFNDMRNRIRLRDIRQADEILLLSY